MHFCWPAQYFMVAGHSQVPAMQGMPVGHTFPHEPQLFLSLTTSLQTPLQNFWPLGQRSTQRQEFVSSCCCAVHATQVPLQSTWPDGHPCLHVQLLLSRYVPGLPEQSSTQAFPQSTVPLGQEQLVVPWQIDPVGQQRSGPQSTPP